MIFPLTPHYPRRLWIGEFFRGSLGGKLEWIEAKKACRAVQRKEQVGFDNEELMTAQLDWLIERAIAFDKVFRPLVKQLKEM